MTNIIECAKCWNTGKYSIMNEEILDQIYGLTHV